MRHSATASLLDRRDVIVVASVSCIYGLGDPEDYRNLMVHLRPGQKKDRDDVILELVSNQYVRNDFELKRGTFRVRGDTLDIWPSSYESVFIRVSFFDDEIEQITEVDRLTQKALHGRTYIAISPASHYATTDTKMERALVTIEEELEERLVVLREEGKLVEAYRLEQRTRYDLEMMRETGFTKGIENYSRHISGRPPGSAPFTLIDFFPDDFLLMFDESHVTIPQIGAMYKGDRSRKESLVDFGFRLPSAFDNRPLMFHEFEQKLNQMIFVSATPSKYEAEHAEQVIQQVIRPTGLLDPQIRIHPIEGQVEDLISSVREVTSRGERALVLTLTKRMAEDFTTFLIENGEKVAYLHSDIANDERLEILRDLRKGRFNVLVGINLLREGLDLPEVSLICILDADQQGFLRSETSLIQIIGRAARNVNGQVVMYADAVTPAMLNAISETNRRRTIQEEYNEEHNITPVSIQKDVRSTLDTFADILDEAGVSRSSKDAARVEKGGWGSGTNVKARVDKIAPTDLVKVSSQLEEEMQEAARQLDFERAAELRDMLIYVRGRLAE